MTVKKEYPESALTDKILNLAIKIHKILGPGFKEKAYEKALAHEFTENKIKFARQKPITIKYDYITVGDQRLDFIVNKKVIVEIKAVPELNTSHKAQILSYLKATGIKVGLLLNFGRNRVEIKRVIH